jgi:hypothetical protein
MSSHPVQRMKLDAMGLDELCVLIMRPMTLTAIAKKVGVECHTLVVWIEADATRSARVRECRVSSALFWDEAAETELRAAKTPMAFARARELASHYRWRAKAIAPQVYGDKIAHDHSGTLTLRELIVGSYKTIEHDPDEGGKE